MKNLIILFFLFQFLPFSITAQHPSFKRLLGTWDTEYYKTEPDSIFYLAPTDLVLNFELTKDSLGLIQNNTLTENGKKVTQTNVAFYDSTQNVVQTISSTGRGIISFLEEFKYEGKGFSFDGTPSGGSSIWDHSSPAEIEILEKFTYNGVACKAWLRATKRK